MYAYLLFTDRRILPITSLVGLTTRRYMHSCETTTDDVYTALSTFTVKHLPVTSVPLHFVVKTLVFFFHD